MIAWILGLGPGGPSGPPEFRSFDAIRDHRCDEVPIGELTGQAATLYAGAKAACQAALDGKAELWADAAKAYDQVSGSENDMYCLDQAVLGLLGRLVTAHRENPDAEFEPGPVSDAQPPPCPTMNGLQPDIGVPGETIRITGSHLDGRPTPVVQVYDGSGALMDSVSVEPSGESLQIVVPEQPAGTPPMLCVVLTIDAGGSGWTAGAAPFTYAGDPSAGGADGAPCPPSAGS